MSVEAKKTKKESKLGYYMQDIYAKKLPILPPDINESDKGFTAVNGKIRFGLKSIKGVGDAAIEEILKHRPYSGLQDVYNKVDNRKVTKTCYEALIKAGCFDFFDSNRKQLLEDYSQLHKNGNIMNNLFGFQEETTEEDITEMEIEVMGMSISNPTEWDLAVDGDELIVEGIVVNAREHITKNGKLMCFCTLKVERNEINCVIFSDVYVKNHDYYQEGFILRLTGKKDDGSLIVKDVKLIEGDFFKNKESA